MMLLRGYFFCQGFFIRTCSEAVFKLAHHAATTKKTFALNLSAEYVCQNFGGHILQLLPSMDFLFGNEQVGF
jgi:sugar/nucleoside kinase (ribokinase family)